MPWRLDETHAGGHHARMIALEIICLQKKEDATCGLVADARRLRRTVRARQEQAGANMAPRPHDHPAFATAERRVLAKLEIQSACEEDDCLVVVRDDETDEGQMLAHHATPQMAASSPSGEGG